MAAGAHWAQKRVVGRIKVREAAFALFESQGFEATTVEAIAEASGVSRRSIFRYFKSKEGIVFSEQHEQLAQFVELVASPKPNESPYSSARRACLTLAKHFMEDREAIIIHYRITGASATLLPLDASLNRAWDDAMLVALTRGQNPSPAQRALAGAMMGMIRAILRGWVEEGAHADLIERGRDGFKALESGFGLS